MLADGLHRIGVKQRAGFVRETRQQFDRKQRSGLVVGPHDGGDGGARAEGLAIGLDIQAAQAVNADPVNHHAAVAFQMGAERQQGGMFDR